MRYVMSKSAKNQTAAKPAKAEKARPTLSPEAAKLLEQLQKFDLAQLRLIEKEVQAAKRAKAPKRLAKGELSDATAKSLAKHKALYNNVKTWLAAGAHEKVRTEGAVLPKSLLQLMMGELGVKGRSKLTEKGQMFNAMIEATAAIEVAKAA
jgi:hypothetical protein